MFMYVGHKHAHTYTHTQTQSGLREGEKEIERLIAGLKFSGAVLVSVI